MARMTKAQLVDENIALRHNLERLEAQVAQGRQLAAAASGEADDFHAEAARRLAREKNVLTVAGGQKTQSTSPGRPSASTCRLNTGSGP